MSQYFGITVKEKGRWISDNVAYTKRAVKRRVIMYKKAGKKCKIYPLRDAEVRGGPKNKEIHKALNKLTRRGFKK